VIGQESRSEPTDSELRAIAFQNRPLASARRAKQTSGRTDSTKLRLLAKEVTLTPALPVRQKRVLRFKNQFHDRLLICICAEILPSVRENRT